jgi:hypothetical protein
MPVVPMEQPKARRGLLTFGKMGTAQARRQAWRPVVETSEILRSSKAWAAWAFSDDDSGRDGSLAPVPYFVERTFVTVGPKRVPRDSSCPPALEAPQTGDDDEDCDSTGASDGIAPCLRSSATASTACPSDAHHKEFLTCSFTKAGYKEEVSSTCDWAAWASKEPGSVASGNLIHIPFKVEKTFVTVKPEAIASPSSARRNQSCPPRVAQPCTVMLRNLPNRAKARRIEEHLNNLGFKDFTMYLPLDPRTGVNKGYVFVRLADRASALAVIQAIHHTRLPDVPGSRSHKKLTAAFAVDQGTLRVDRGGQRREHWPRS